MLSSSDTLNLLLPATDPMKSKEKCPFILEVAVPGKAEDAPAVSALFGQMNP